MLKVTQVALLPTEQSHAAQRPELTPELLAASGARYSRNNEGLESILKRIDPDNMDRSVDSIFKMIDYGHQSIADMAPVAMFIDNLSIWMALYVWSLCPTAGGQESSTRYIEISPDALVAPERLGIPKDKITLWQTSMQRSFDAYQSALNSWEQIGQAIPEITSIPTELLNDPDEKAAKARQRMQRNFRFDRARYYLPLAAATNMMMVMSARGWVNLCQYLCSHPLTEATELGNAIATELALTAPRLLKHATRKTDIAEGLTKELAQWQAQLNKQGLPENLTTTATNPTALCTPSLEVMPPANTVHFDGALQPHSNRYGWTGNELRRTAVRYQWRAMAIAEIRDLNRHRTGSRYCPLLPAGFYAATEQLPTNSPATVANDFANVIELQQIGRDLTAQMHQGLQSGDPSAVYFGLLGTQLPFERTTTADKFIYEAELRTGIGAHFRYAQHYRDVLALWYQRYPETQGLILEGNAEPE